MLSGQTEIPQGCLTPFNLLRLLAQTSVICLGQYLPRCTLTQTRVPCIQGRSIEELLNQIGLWAFLCDIFLIVK